MGLSTEPTTGQRKGDGRFCWVPTLVHCSISLPGLEPLTSQDLAPKKPTTFLNIIANVQRLNSEKDSCTQD